jgi:putative peptidoglycan lipid II flippase
MATMILSKILGLIRTRLLFHHFSTDTADIFFAATQLPDLIFNLVIFGALSVAFIPVFISYSEKEGKEEAFKMARAVLNSLLMIFIFCAVLIFIFAPQITSLSYPKFPVDKQNEVVELTRIILFGQTILVLGSFFIGILQSFQRFLVSALASVVYNLGSILGILFFAESLGIKSPAIGMVLGALLHALIQYPLIHSLGFRFTFPPTISHAGVKEILHLMGWRSIGLAVEQINEKVGIALAALLSGGSLTVLAIAQQLQVVPIGLFGATLAQAALPVLSSERARGKIEEFKITLLTTLHQILFLVLPAAAILIVIRIPVVRLVFGAAQFDWDATVLTGKTLAFLSIGLASQSISLLLVRGFYALKNTKIPVIVSLIVVSVNLVLALFFILILKLEVWSIGLAYSLSAILSSLLLFWTLHKKVGGFNLKQVYSPFGKMLMASIVMGMALYIPIKLLDQVIFDTTRTVNLIILTGLSSIFALSVYVLLVWYLKVTELSTYVNLIKNGWSKLSKPSNVKTKEVTQEPESF